MTLFLTFQLMTVVMQYMTCTSLLLMEDKQTSLLAFPGSIFQGGNYYIYRAPETSKVKAKMIYAGSKDALGRALVGVAVKISATDMSELTESIVIEACRKFN